MVEIVEVKKLFGKKNLVNLVAGDVVPFGFWEEPSLFYDYPELEKGELFFLSRLEYSGVKGCIGVIFEHADNLKTEKQGYFYLNHSANMLVMSDEEFENLLRKNNWTSEDYSRHLQEQLPKTRDGLFHYGVNLITKKIKDEKDKEILIENPEKYKEFNKALNEAKL